MRPPLSNYREKGFLVRVPEHASSIVLLVFLFAAVVTDIRSRTIPNVLVASGISSGLLVAIFFPHAMGWLSAVAGLIVGFAVFLPMYALHAMGAGDVKLMAMVGTFLGPVATLEAVLWVLIAGGLLALLFAARRGIVRRTLASLRSLFYSAAASAQTRNLPDFSDIPSAAKLPYAVAIATGVGAFLLARAAGFSLL